MALKLGKLGPIKFWLVCIPEFRANFLFFGISMAWFLSRIYWSSLDHDLMASIREKAISILVGNLNSSSSYLITAVTRYLILATENQSFEVHYKNRDSSNIQPCQTYCIILWTTCVQGWGFVMLKLLDYQ